MVKRMKDGILQLKLISRHVDLSRAGLVVRLTCKCVDGFIHLESEECGCGN